MPKHHWIGNVMEQVRKALNKGEIKKNRKKISDQVKKAIRNYGNKEPAVRRN